VRGHLTPRVGRRKAAVAAGRKIRAGGSEQPRRDGNGAHRLAAAHDLSKAEAARVLDTVTGAIVGAVKKGDPVQILGFGTFKQVARAARSGFNPQAGTKIKIAATKVPKFVPGAAFKAAIDPKAAKRKAEKAAAKPAVKKAAAAPKKAAAKKK